MNNLKDDIFGRVKLVLITLHVLTSSLGPHVYKASLCGVLLASCEVVPVSMGEYTEVTKWNFLKKSALLLKIQQKNQSQNNLISLCNELRTD